MENDLQIERFNTILALPSLIALLVALAIFVSKKKRSLLLENIYSSSFLMSLIGMNALEVIAFENISSNYNILVRLYYCFLTVMLSSFVCLGIRLNRFGILKVQKVGIYFLITDILIIGIILGSDIFISGATFSSHTILRLPGNYYWIFLSYLFSCLMVGLFFTLRSIYKAEHPLDKRRHIVIFYSLLPLILTLTFVFVMIQIGTTVNLSILLPISSLIFLLIYLFTENKIDLFRILVNIPFSEERKAYVQLNTRVLEYIAKTQTDEPVPLKDFLNDIEKIFIKNALEIKDGNHNLAAELLSISLSTVYRHKNKIKPESGTDE